MLCDSCGRRDSPTWPYALTYFRSIVNGPPPNFPQNPLKNSQDSLNTVKGVHPATYSAANVTWIPSRSGIRDGELKLLPTWEAAVSTGPSQPFPVSVFGILVHSIFLKTGTISSPVYLAWSFFSARSMQYKYKAFTPKNLLVSYNDWLLLRLRVLMLRLGKFQPS